MRATLGLQSTRWILVLLLGVTAAAGSILAAVVGAGATTAMLVLLSAAGILGIVALTHVRRRFDPLSPVVAFGSLYFLYMGVGSNNTGYFLGSYVSNEQWLLYLFGFLFYLGGAAIAGAVRLSPSPRLTEQTESAWNSASRRRNTLAALGIGSFALSFAASGIPLFMNVNTARFLFWSPLGPLWPFSIRMVAAAAVVSVVMYYIKSSPGVRRRSHVIIGLACISALVLLGSRAFLVPVAVCGLVARSFFLKRVRISSLAAGGLVAIIVLSMFASFRTSSERGRATDFLRTQLTLYGLPSRFQVLGSAYLSALNGPHVLARILQVVPASVPYQYGGFFLGEAATLLPGKQLLPDQWVAVNIVRTITVQMSGRLTHLGQAGGIPPTLLGGFYLDGGLLGVAIGMLAVGFTLQLLYRRAETNSTTLDVALYGVVLSYFLLSIYSMVTLKFTEVALWLFVPYVLWPLRGCGVSDLREEPDQHA